MTFKDNGDGTATLSGTPDAGTGGTYAHDHRRNGVGPDATQTFTLTVNEAPAITSADDTTFTIGPGGHLHHHDHRLPDRGPQRDRGAAQRA